MKNTHTHRMNNSGCGMKIASCDDWRTWLALNSKLITHTKKAGNHLSVH